MSSQEEVDRDYKAILATVKRLKLPAREAAEYVRRHMEGFGHKGTTSTVWSPGGDKGTSSGGGFLAGLFDNKTDDDD